MRKTKEEKNLLAKMLSGIFDGLVGDIFTTSGGSTVWTEIKDGKPTRYKKGPGGKFFNGKENERYEGVLHIQEEWSTDEEKLGFLRKFGWLLKDDEAQAYSAKYKPKKEEK